MNKTPLVSIIICVYNGEEFLVDAITSAIEQSYPRVELIVVDDGSTDRSAEIASSFPKVKLIRNPKNLGLPLARNVGLSNSTGEYIAFLDADDQWTEDKLAKQVAFHQKNPEVKYSYCMERFIYVGEGEAPNWTKKKEFQSDHMAYHMTGAIIKASLFSVVGEFKTDFGNSNDSADWIFRAKDMGFFGGEIKEVFLLRRIHRENLSHGVPDQTATLLKALKNSIERQKKSND